MNDKSGNKSITVYKCCKHCDMGYQGCMKHHTTPCTFDNCIEGTEIEYVMEIN